jgi:hypothetical protein
MIYALTTNETTPENRIEIATTILGFQNVQPYVEQGIIVHIMDVEEGRTYYCIHCANPVRPSRNNPPGQPRPQHKWYFKHVSEHRCLDTAFGLGDGLINPTNQGCYILLGLQGYQPQQCFCRRDNISYCHHAFIHEACPPIEEQA